MELLVVRHAIACERDASRWTDDSRRPLSAAGERRFRRAVAGLAKVTQRPVRVFCSPYVRAVQTADVLAEVAGWPAPRTCDELIPGASTDAVLRVLRGCQVRRLAIVGHEPDLGELIVACLARGADFAFPMKKGAVACLNFAKRPSRGGASLKWYLPPKMLRRVGT